MLSLAKDSQAPRMGRHTIYALRVVLAAVWLFWGVRNGLFWHVYGTVPRGKQLADSLIVGEPYFSVLMGVVMIFLAFWLLAGWASRTCATFQLVWLFFLWWVTYVDGARLLETIFEQLPLLALIVMVWFYGPGSCVWTRKRRRSTWTRG